jgi:RND family efflux transporter MFP subunit
MRRFLAVVPLIALVIAGCGRQGEDSDGLRRPAPIPVEVTAIERGSITAFVRGTGTIAARDDVLIAAEAGGRVVDVPVVVGDGVEVGDVLVVLDDELSALAVKQAEAQLLMAEADLRDAEAGLKRASYLWKSGDISDTDYEAAETRAIAAHSVHMTAEAVLAGSSRQLRDALVTSPIAGTVAFVHIEEGQLVAPGTPVVHIINDARLEVELGLGEEDVVNVKPGARAEIEVRPLPGEVFRGRVEYVGPRADDLTKTYPVGITVRNRDGALRAGMVADVGVAARVLRDVIVIQRDWVLDRYGEPTVFVAVDSVAVLRKISLGRVVGARVVVLAGLEPGDKLVTVGLSQLSDGARIGIKTEQ